MSFSIFQLQIQTDASGLVYLNRLGWYQWWSLRRGIIGLLSWFIGTNALVGLQNDEETKDCALWLGGSLFRRKVVESLATTNVAAVVILGESSAWIIACGSGQRERCIPWGNEDGKYDLLLLLRCVRQQLSLGESAMGVEGREVLVVSFSEDSRRLEKLTIDDGHGLSVRNLYWRSIPLHQWGEIVCGLLTTKRQERLRLAYSRWGRGIRLFGVLLVIGYICQSELKRSDKTMTKRMDASHLYDRLEDYGEMIKRWNDQIALMEHHLRNWEYFDNYFEERGVKLQMFNSIYPTNSALGEGEQRKVMVRFILEEGGIDIETIYRELKSDIGSGALLELSEVSGDFTYEIRCVDELI